MVEFEQLELTVARPECIRSGMLFSASSTVHAMVLLQPSIQPKVGKTPLRACPLAFSPCGMDPIEHTANLGLVSIKYKNPC
jgi:hypothetical protein